MARTSLSYSSKPFPALSGASLGGGDRLLEEEQATGLPSLWAHSTGA